jgi:L-seryl-tRNA(Ser) seleniumtransferase
MKIPSINELLESPQLKPWVERASRNVVVTSAKTFVTRLATDLQSRAAEMKMPNVGELAEKIAEWIAKRQASAPHAEINATGVLLPVRASLPLADEALHAVASLRDYVIDRQAGSQTMVAELARQLTGAEGCLVTSSHSGAMLLALAALCHDRPAIVARGQVGEIAPGSTLPQLARCAGVLLRECGIVERAAVQDYEEVAAGAGAILSIASPRAALHEEVALSELAALAQRHHLPLVVHLGFGGMIDATKYGLTGIGNAKDAISQGADLVILAGDRLLGGPPCGLVLGREAVVDRLRRHGLFASLAAASVVLLPLAATLELHQDLDVAERAIPLLALLSTSVENLKSRADRLSQQLAASPLVASAVVEGAPATLTADAHAGAPIPGFAVSIEPRNAAAEALAQRLAGGTLPIAVRVANQRLLLNLRTVLPRQDMQIVEAFEALGGTSEAASAEVPSPS